MIRASLSADERTALERAFDMVREKARSPRAKAAGGASTLWLARVLSDNGHPVSREMVRRHASGQCSCDA